MTLSDDECMCTEICLVCRKPFLHISQFRAHNHPEAIARHRSYKATALAELTREARDKLHRMLIDASKHEDTATKRGLEEADLDQDQISKRARMLEMGSDIPVLMKDLEVHGIPGHLPAILTTRSNIPKLKPQVPPRGRKVSKTHMHHQCISLARSYQISTPTHMHRRCIDHRRCITPMTTKRKVAGKTNACHFSSK